MLREVKVGELVDALRRQVIVDERRAAVAVEYEAARDDRIRAALTEGLTDTYLALLASRYVGITRDGQRGPLAVLAGITGRTESSVKGHLWQARKRGLLEGSAGRAGGRLTEKAHGLIREAQSKG
ncbi:hypothetical protein HX744_14465 [Pseudonocardia sp. ICBG1122]|nr:hypothetical protein [Pseudonocardia pini]